MKLWELFEGKEPGTYAAARLDSASVTLIKKYLNDNNISNPVDTKELHCTILYSTKPCPNYKAAGKYDKPIAATDGKLQIWPSQKGKNVLVLLLKCQGLTDRHEELMDEHKASYDFDEYKPHVTLSYDFGDGKVKDLPPFKHTLRFDVEYREDLND